MYGNRCCTCWDKGSLVSLSEYSTVGSLMGSLSKGSFSVEGQVARLMYQGLHKQHQLAGRIHKKLRLSHCLK